MPHDQSNEARIRSNVSSAGFSGALLLFFGLFMFAFPTVPAEGKTWFYIGDTLFNYTLRVGGSMMLLVALVSTSGKPIALLCDCVASVIVGLCLLTAGVMMIADNGAWLNPVLMIAYGLMMISTGSRSGREFAAINAEAKKLRPRSQDQVDRLTAENRRDTESAPTQSGSSTKGNLAAELRRRRERDEVATTDAIDAPKARPSPPSQPANVPALSADPSTSTASNTPAPAPPGGFLASFANKPPQT